MDLLLLGYLYLYLHGSYILRTILIIRALKWIHFLDPPRPLRYRGPPASSPLAGVPQRAERLSQGQVLCLPRTGEGLRVARRIYIRQPQVYLDSVSLSLSLAHIYKHMYMCVYVHIHISICVFTYQYVLFNTCPQTRTSVCLWNTCCA